MSDSERKIGDLTVHIDRDTCIGSGNCVNVASDLFEIDDEGVAAFCEKPGADREKTLEACRICPVEALVVRDEDGQQIVP
jgi:ferredoxin